MVFSPSGNGEVTIDINAEDNASESIDGIAGSLGTMQTAAVAAGGALAAIGVSSLVASANAAADFESAMVEVEKVTGATSGEMEEFNQMVMDMSTEIPLAQEELAALTADAARFGIEGSENIREFTEVTARMATATNLNTDEAGESLAKLAELTNTPVKEIENLGSAINSLSNSAATSSQGIVDAMLRSSGALTQLGADQTEIAGLSTALNDVSESSQRAGTRLRRLAQEMMDPKKIGDLSDALGMTTEEFKNMREEDPVGLMREMAVTMNEGEEEADILRSTLSTTSRQAVAGLSNNLDELDDAMQNANESFKEGTSLQEEFGAQMDTFKSQVQLLKNRLKNVAITTGQALLPALSDALDVVNDLIGNFAEFNESTDGMAGAISGMSATVAGLTLALGVLAGVSLGPLVAAIAAVGAAVAGLALAWETNFLDIQGHTDDLLEAVEDFSADVTDSFSVLEDETESLQDTIEDAFSLSEKQTEELQETISQAVDLIEDALDRFADAINFLVVNFYEPLMGRIEELTEEHLGETVDEFIETFNVIVDRVEWFVNKFETFWEEYGDEIISIIKPILKLLEILFATTFDALFTTVRVILNLIQGDWEEVWEAIEGFTDRTFGRLETAFTALKDALTAIWDLQIQLLEEAWDAFWNGVEAVLDAAIDAIQSAINGFVDWMENQWDNFVNSLETAWENAWDAVEQTLEDAFDSMVEFIHSVGEVSVYDAFYSVGQAIRGVFTTVFDAIAGAGGLLRAFFTDITDYVRTGAKEDAEQAFTFLMDGIEQTWEDMVDAVIGAGGVVKVFISDTVDYIRTGARDDITQAFQNLLDAAQTKWDDFKSDVIGVGSTIKLMISDIYTYITTDAKEDVVEAFDTLIGGVMDAFQGLYDGLIGNSLIPDMIEAIADYLKGSDVIQRLKGAATTMLDGIYNAFVTLFDNIVKPAGSGMSLMNMMIDEIVTLFESNSMISSLRDAAGVLISGAKEAIRDFVDWAMDKLRDVGDGIDETRTNTNNNNSTHNSRTGESTQSDSGGGGGGDTSDSDDSSSGGGGGGGDTSDSDDSSSGSDDNYGSEPTHDEGQEDSNNDSSGSDSSDDEGSSGSDDGFWSDPADEIGDTIGDIADGARDFLGFANGGVVTSPVAGVIGETGQNEAVVPLDRLNTMLDTSYEAGVSGGASSANVNVSISVEGDDKLAEIIRENAEVVVEDNEESKQDRVKRFR